MTEFDQLLKERRSTYVMSANTSVSEDAIVSRLRENLQQVPTAYNAQTTRYVVLFGDANKKLWQHLYDVQKDVLQSDQWEQYGPVIESYQNVLGTVVFFEDQDALEHIPGGSRETYKQNNAGNGQLVTWLTLTELGLGATLNHFNIGYAQGFDSKVRELFNLPDTYEMTAQMPFGAIEQAPYPKETISTDEQVKVIKG
ncbi:MAG: nitroreductase family protein [Aerococcus sp.]|nr:nitroreductase family protein [Aerococcus sp.]